MKRNRFTEEQIIGILPHCDDGNKAGKQIQVGSFPSTADAMIVYWHLSDGKGLSSGFRGHLSDSLSLRRKTNTVTQPPSSHHPPSAPA